MFSRLPRVAAAVMASGQSGAQLEVTLPCGRAIGAPVQYPVVPGQLQAAVFRSLPYGHIPVRWMPPVRAPCWHGTLNTTKHTTVCWQEGGRATRPPTVQSEDCLNLDVYAAIRATSSSSSSSSSQSSQHLRSSSRQVRLRPVVVWLYGGSLVHGSSSSYPGLGALALLEDIVLVVPNYRIGAHGFLSHPALDMLDPRNVSGNYGLLDQQLALSWVAANARAFGGDPTRVSVLGQSSGGTSILALLSSPASKGLFQSAISLSASPNISMGLQQAHSQFDATIRKTTPCGGASSLAAVGACLHNLSAAEVASILPAAVYDVEPSLPRSPSGEAYAGLIVVDGVTVVADAETALRSGLVDVPLLLQTQLAEMDTYENNATIDRLTPAEFGQLLAQRLVSGGANTSAAADLAATVLDTYRSELAISVELGSQVFVADYSMLCGGIALGLAASHGFRSPVYLSVGTHAPCHPLPVLPGRPPCRYSGHNFDLIAAIRSWSFYAIHFGAQPYAPCPSDARWGDVMRQQWINLTRDGRLGPSFLPARSADRGVAAGDYQVGLQTAAGTVMSTNYGRERCAALAAVGIDKRFWLTN